MREQGVAALFYQEWEKIRTSTTDEQPQQLEALYRLLNLLFVEATRKERLQFTTLFARIVYACQTKKVEKRLQLHVHHFRKAAQEVLYRAKLEKAEAASSAGLHILPRIIAALLDTPVPATVLAKMPKQFGLAVSDVKVQAFQSVVRVLVIGDDPRAEQLLVQSEAKPSETVRVQYNLPERNENFMPTIAAIRKIFGFPITVNLLDVEIDVDGVYRPRAFVVEPDYLVDVSAVAECFKDFGAEPLLYLLKKYLPFSANKYLMIGNIANFFLDELMSDPNATFKAIFPKIFPIYPLAFSLFDDALIREIYQRVQRHYLSLKQMVVQDFKAQGIDPAHCFLEPSFFSETYGLQGRLDVLYRKDEQSAIVELKSGRPFKPNQYGISHSHFIQTLLYDLMIQSTFGKGTDPKNYILYSVLERDQLRFAPRIKAQQFEALQLRNQLVAIEWDLKNSTKIVSGHNLDTRILERTNSFLKLSTARFAHVKGFVRDDIALFESTYQRMGALTQKYFNAFSGFIAREHQLAKTGVEGMERINGQAALWRDALEEKQERFDLLRQLRIESNHTQAEDPIIVFERTAETHSLANFRKGDITVLYPLELKETDRPPVLMHQIFKCTIIDINAEEVRVRLRTRQFNASIFEQYTYWNLERDLLDSSFVALYRGLFQFAQCSKAKKELLLTKRAPRKSKAIQLDVPAALTQEQQQIFQQALAAEEYFLLWGPPGTGKTSMMLRDFVQHLLENTEENLLLLAYTNRAVDEICDAIESIAPNIREQYLRIGSRFATQERFQEQLLQSKIAGVSNRRGIRKVLQSHRIFVGTVSSVASKLDLLQLKKFHRVIIDEASQILEPMLVGLLTHFQRFILIGDHRQLPAVVVQDPEESHVRDEHLNSIGLKNLRNSLFERLYLRAKVQGWTWAYAQLQHQGRMHEDIMAFPSRYFYEDRLQILPEGIAHRKNQQAPIPYSQPSHDLLIQRISQQRMCFLPTPVDQAGSTRKTNRHEANLISQLVRAFKQLIEAQGKVFHAGSIGIITPYRAQIAQIRQVLEIDQIDYSQITIDTVERYQGGARDIILISLCTNTRTQLQSLISLSDEGIDRKLNVALTRARKQLVLVGNPELLQQSPIYAELLQFCGIVI